jgi:endonuclease YncB( thermonuclease family)
MKNGSGVIKKIILVLILLLVGGVGYYIYSNPEVQVEIKDAKWILENRDPEMHKSVEWREGQIVKVLDGNWVFIKIPEGFVYGLRIRGLEAPTLAVLLGDDTLKMGKEAHKFLEELTLRKNIQFQSIDMNDMRYGHGYIEFQGKSIVLPMVKAGMAKLNRSEVTHLPYEDLHELIKAEREAQESETGIWDTSLELDWTMGDFSEQADTPGL